MPAFHKLSQRRLSGDTVRILREALGLKSVVLAGQVGITPAYLSMIERKGRQPRNEIIIALAKALGTTVDAIAPVTSYEYNELSGERVNVE